MNAPAHSLVRTLRYGDLAIDRVEFRKQLLPLADVIHRPHAAAVDVGGVG